MVDEWSAPSGIRTRDSSNQAAADLRLRPRTETQHTTNYILSTNVNTDTIANMRFQALGAACIRMTAFWDMASCSLVKVEWCSGCAPLRHQSTSTGSLLNYALSWLTTVVGLRDRVARDNKQNWAWETTRRHIPEGFILNVIETCKVLPKMKHEDGRRPCAFTWFILCINVETNTTKASRFYSQNSLRNVGFFFRIHPPTRLQWRRWLVCVL
jgi:hypothetical protein